MGGWWGRHQAVEKTDVAYLIPEVNYTVWEDNIDPHKTPSCLKIETSEDVNENVETKNGETKNGETPNHQELTKIFSDGPVDKLSNNAVLNPNKNANIDCLLNILIGLVSAHTILKFVQ